MTAVHACPEDVAYRVLCRSDDGGPMSCRASDWTCRDCLRMVRLLTRVHESMGRLRRQDDLRTALAAVAPGTPSVESLDEAEMRRLLAVLDRMPRRRRR